MILQYDARRHHIPIKRHCQINRQFFVIQNSLCNIPFSEHDTCIQKYSFAAKTLSICLPVFNEKERTEMENMRI